MEVYFQLINDAAGIKKAYDELIEEEYLGFDTETTALDPYEGNIRLIQFSNGKNTYVIDLKPFADKGDLKTMPELAPLRDLIAAPKPIKIAHNAKFDAKWIRHHLGTDVNGIFDTLLASQLIAAGDQDRRHNLAEVANFFLGVELDKSEQVSDWSAAELSQSQIQYAAKDAAIMVGLREKVVERLKQDELIKVAKLEFDCVMPIAQMELNGFYLDEARWREQLEKVKIAQSKVALELQQMLSAGVAQASLFGVTEINLDSQQQVTDALKNLGVPVPATTRGWQLQPLALEYPVVAKLLEYRGVAKSLSSFGENILEFIKPQTGRLHSDFRQIGAPTGRFSCLTGDALVATSKGFKQMCDLQNGDLVKTSFGFKQVLKKWSNGIRSVFEVTLKDGRKIRATADHKFLTEKGDVWKRLDELKPDDNLFVSLKEDLSNQKRKTSLNFDLPDFHARKPVTVPTLLSSELCELTGLIIADGFLGKRQIRPIIRSRWGGKHAVYDRIYLSCNRDDKELIEKINQSGLKIFGQPFREVKSRSCCVLQLASTKVAEFLAAFGLEGNAHTKKIPEIILSSSENFQAAFLRGLFEGDGHHGQMEIGLTSVNQKLLRQVQIMLANLGIYSTVKIRNDKSGFSGASRYGLHISGKSDRYKFLKKIGFISKRKNWKPDFTPQITDGVATPFIVSGAKLYKEAVNLGIVSASRQGVKPFIPYYRHSFMKAETVEKLINKFGMLPSLKPICNYLESNLRQVKIQSIVYAGEEEVFDITVEDVHQFIANGIVVHNCSKPNIQQIPHEEAYRRCFLAPEGRKLIIADYSQIELRILADFSNDENFINAFKTGADFHTITAAQVFNVKPEEVSAEQRSFAKRLNFGVVYGIGSQRFALMTGLSQSQAEDTMRKYFGTYRGLDAWLRDASRKVVSDRQARTASGRLHRFRFEEGDRAQIGAAQRNGKNFPIQGTSADILKRALHLLHEELQGTSAKLVNIVHDEIIVESGTTESEQIADKLEKAMCAAGEEYVKKVPVKVDVKITQEWTK